VGIRTERDRGPGRGSGGHLLEGRSKSGAGELTTGRSAAKAAWGTSSPRAPTVTPAENLPKKERLERSPAGAFWGEEACIDAPRRPTRAGAAGRKQVHWVAIMANKVILTSILRS